MPANWTLVCLGRDDGIGEDLRQQALRIGLSKHVRWEGVVDNVADYLCAAHIGVLASHEEGFSNAVLEGMAAALPMIVTAVGGNPEAVIDGVCGRVVAPRDPEALAQAILELARDPERRKTMGCAARERVACLFSLDRCVALYRELYGDLAAGIAPPIPAEAHYRAANP